MNLQKYSPKQQEKQYLNLLFNAHDQFCFCKEPANHTIYLLKETKTMPWYRNYYKRRWRRPRFRRWRFGKIIRRRYRYPRTRVRKYKKLKRLTLKTWQPHQIRKCYIKGLYCLVYINSKRLSWNSVMYEDSTVPEFLPGGGGFAVMKFTLFNLYDMHEKCENWWTNSNDNLPLCRYLGCRLKMYQSEFVDYVLNYSNSNSFC